MSNRMKKMLCVILSLTCMFGCLTSCSTPAINNIDRTDEMAVAEGYIEAIYSADTETVFKLLPDKVFESICDSNNKTEDEFIEYAKTKYSKQLESFDEECGEGWTLSYEIHDYKDYEYFLQVLPYYKDYGYNVSSLVYVTYDCTLEGPESTREMRQYAAFIKIADTWYLDSNEMMFRG